MVAAPDRRLRVAIVGGGIGGLSLAVGLANEQKKGAKVDFKIYEAAPAFGEIGAGVGCGPNAVKTLEALGMGKEFSEIARKHEAENAGDQTYFIWRHGEKQYLPSGSKDDGISRTYCRERGGHVTVHRARFLEILVSRLPEGVAEFDKRLQSFTVDETRPDGAVQLTFQDGTTAFADVIVGADGVKSRVRELLLKDVMSAKALRPRFTGTRVYRSLAPMKDVADALGDKAWKPTMYLGKDKHILTFPIDHGKTFNIVAFQTDRSVPDPYYPPNEPWIVPSTVDEMMEGWEGWSDDCQTILQSIKKTDKWHLHELEDLPTHAVGRGVIMGDSAAATLPHQGQGAAMAIESGYILSALLSDPRVNSDNVAKALQAFDRMRRERVTRLKRTSNELGAILEFNDGVINGDERLLAENLSTRYDWIWTWDPEQERAQALRGLSDCMDEILGKADGS